MYLDDDATHADTVLSDQTRTQGFANESRSDVWPANATVYEFGFTLRNSVRFWVGSVQVELHQAWNEEHAISVRGRPETRIFGTRSKGRRTGTGWKITWKQTSVPEPVWVTVTQGDLIHQVTCYSMRSIALHIVVVLGADWYRYSCLCTLSLKYRRNKYTGKRDWGHREARSGFKWNLSRTSEIA